jgi:hypothetical protein
VKCCKTCNIFSALSRFRAKMLHLLQHFALEWAVRHKNVAYFATFLTRLGGADRNLRHRHRPCSASKPSVRSVPPLALLPAVRWLVRPLASPRSQPRDRPASPRSQPRDRPSQSPEPTPGHPLVPAPVPSRLHRPLPLFALTDPGHLGSRQLPGALLQLQRDLGADGAIAGAVFGALDQGGVFVNLDFVDAQEHAF